MGSNALRISGKALQLDPNVKPEELPLVAVLDSGVEFPDRFSELVVELIMLGFLPPTLLLMCRTSSNVWQKHI